MQMDNRCGGCQAGTLPAECDSEDDSKEPTPDSDEEPEADAEDQGRLQGRDRLCARARFGQELRRPVPEDGEDSAAAHDLERLVHATVHRVLRPALEAGGESGAAGSARAAPSDAAERHRSAR